MSTYYVNSEEDFLAINGIGSAYTAIVLNTDLDFTGYDLGLTARTSVLSINDAVRDFDGSGKSIVGLRLDFSGTSGRYFIAGGINLRMRNFGKISASVSIPNATLYFIRANAFDNVNVVMRGEVMFLSGIFYNSVNVTNCALYIRLNAANGAYLIAGTDINKVRVEGSIVCNSGSYSTFLSANVVVRRSYINLNMRARDSSCGFTAYSNNTLGTARPYVIDCVLEGSYEVYGGGVFVGIGHRARVSRCVVRASMQASTVSCLTYATTTGVAEAFDSVVDADIFGNIAYFVNANAGYTLNCFRSDRSTANGVNTGIEDGTANGYPITVSDLADDNFYRDVLGFDI